MLALARQTNPGVTFHLGNFLDHRPEWCSRWDLVSCMWYAYGLVESMEDRKTRGESGVVDVAWGTLLRPASGSAPHHRSRSSVQNRRVLGPVRYQSTRSCGAILRTTAQRCTSSRSPRKSNTCRCSSASTSGPSNSRRIHPRCPSGKDGGCNNRLAKAGGVEHNRGRCSALAMILRPQTFTCRSLRRPFRTNSCKRIPSCSLKRVAPVRFMWRWSKKFSSRCEISLLE